MIARVWNFGVIGFYRSINLLENGEIKSDNMRIVEVYNEYFANITYELDLTGNEANHSLSGLVEDPIDKVVKKYKNHPWIKRSSLNGLFNIYLSSGKLKQKTFLSNLSGWIQNILTNS